ncbi:MAG: threonine--tRNA ligase [Chloroflexi bacterium]|nr:threonine--tRNA ligase [Chloroflexota bacterium]
MAVEQREQADRLVRMRHSAAHVMAEAVQSLFPDARFGIGPVIEDGFYYDMQLPRALSPEDLATVEERMRAIVKANVPFEHWEAPKDEARRIFADQPFKLELIEEIPGDTVSIYRQGSFTDLCRGPHVDRSGQIGPFKLLSLAGAYWRGDEHRPMLQRIYGTAWPAKDELAAYLKRLEEAERRDHRRLGKELDLFSVSEQVGSGLVLWHPKGGRIRYLVERFWREAHYRYGYEMVYSPHIGRADLWQTSGHLDFYREGMYAPMDIEGQAYYAKPMNCPFHIEIYRSRLRSYKELPMRFAELGTVYRYERSGVLHGLLRVRGFTQDDSHIFCQPEQIVAEILGCLDLTMYLLRSFGFEDFTFNLATRPEKFVGDPADWDRATEALRRALETRSFPYEVDEGGGAFYGPKIDIKIKDALGRAWQCTTIQFDFNMSARFDMTYIGEDGRQHRPFMVHRALLGSMERFFGILIEHYGGAFPVWLAPVQAVVIPIADRHADYADEVRKQLEAAGLRVEVDARSERMNAKIREAQLQKIPYMLVVGDAEAASGQVAVRLRSGENRGPQPLAKFIDDAQAAVEAKV